MLKNVVIFSKALADIDAVAKSLASTSSTCLVPTTARYAPENRNSFWLFKNFRQNLFVRLYNRWGITKRSPKDHVRRNKMISTARPWKGCGENLIPRSAGSDWLTPWSFCSPRYTCTYEHMHVLHTYQASWLPNTCFKPPSILVHT